MDISKIVDKCWDHRITVAELERNAGLSNGLIGKWKTGSPRLENLRKVADYFGCPISELLVERETQAETKQ